MPAETREPCALTVMANPILADLEAAYHLRGVDVRECDGKRGLAVATHDEEHRLEAAHVAAREERNRSFWKRVTPWRED